MDSNAVIERWRVPLLGVIAEMFAEIGLTEGGTVERVPKPVHRFVLRILRTAESAVRRLIIAAARDIIVEYKPRPPAAPKKPKASGENGLEAKAKRKRRPLFNLFDALKRYGRRFKKKARRAEPRIHVFGPDPRIPEFLRSQASAPTPAPVRQKVIVDDGMVSAANLVRRLVAVMDAAQDIQHHAMRLARWQARPRKSAVPSVGVPCAPVALPGSAAGPSTKSTRSSKNATGSPAVRCLNSTTRRKGQGQTSHIAMPFPSP